MTPLDWLFTVAIVAVYGTGYTAWAYLTYRVGAWTYRTLFRKGDNQ